MLSDDPDPPTRRTSDQSWNSIVGARRQRAALAERNLCSPQQQPRGGPGKHIAAVQVASGSENCAKNDSGGGYIQNAKGIGGPAIAARARHRGKLSNNTRAISATATGINDNSYNSSRRCDCRIERVRLWGHVWGSDEMEEGLVVTCRELVLCNSGTCGVYFVRDDRGRLAGVFKPAGQEHIPEELSIALEKGESMFRERAAYVLSRELGNIWRVPKTVLATVRHPTLAGGEQRGSLQRFVADAVDMSDMGPDGLADEEVHRVGMLDLLLMNLDRHEGNMLMKQGSTENGVRRSLVPIDHGLCLPRVASPSSCPDELIMRQMSFVWQGWRQSTRPFGDAPKQLAMSLTQAVVGELAGRIVADTPGLSPQALTTLKIGAALVRVGVGAGLTLSDIASFVVSGGLSRALASAWKRGEEGAGYGEWEAGFIGRLEESLKLCIRHHGENLI